MLQTCAAHRGDAGLVEDVLDFSKIEAGKVTLEKADFDLHALLNSTAAFWPPRLQPRAWSSWCPSCQKYRPRCRRPALPAADPDQPGCNAVKFTERSVTVHVSRKAKPNLMCASSSLSATRGSVFAGGAGEHLRELYAGDQSTTRRFGGTGWHDHREAARRPDGGKSDWKARSSGSTFWSKCSWTSNRSAWRRQRRVAGARVLLVGFPEAQREPLDRALAGWGRPGRGRRRRGGRGGSSPKSAWRSPITARALRSGEDPKLAQRFRRALRPAPPTVLAVPRDADVARSSAVLRIHSGTRAALRQRQLSMCCIRCRR